MSEGQTRAGAPMEEHGSGAEEEIRHADGRVEHTAVRYEPQDIRFGCLLAVVAAAGCVLAALGYLVWHFYWFQAAAQAERKKSLYPLAPATSAQLPPQPRLEQIERMEGAESADALHRLAAKEKALHRYGSTAEKGFVQIPIEQAMKVVAGTLPVAKDSSQGAVHASGLVDDGASNSGRMFRGPSP